MNATAWVGVAGILGTLLAAILTPIVTERMRREGVRQERLLGLRLEVYADLLEVIGRLRDNAMTWSAIPLADLKETPDDVLNRLISRVRAIASDQVYAIYREIHSSAHEFNLKLYDAKRHHQRLLEEKQVDDARSLLQRMGLGEVADRLNALYGKLETTIRQELKP